MPEDLSFFESLRTEYQEDAEKGSLERVIKKRRITRAGTVMGASVVFYGIATEVNIIISQDFDDGVVGEFAQLAIGSVFPALAVGGGLIYGLNMAGQSRAYSRRINNQIQEIQ